MPVPRSSLPHALTTALLASLLLLAGCDGGPTWNQDGAPVGDDDVVVPPTTNVLGTEAVDAMETEPTNQYGALPSTLVFDAEADMADVDEGDVIASDVHPKAPVGFLRKVVERRTENGKVVLETRPAALDEAIDRGRIDTSITINANTVTGQKLQRSLEKKYPRGAGSLPKALGGFCSGATDSICVQIEVPVYERNVGGGGGGTDSTAATVTLAIAQAFKQTIDLDINVGLGGLRKFEFQVTSGSRTTLGFIGTVEAVPPIEYNKELIERRLTTFTVFAGPVPVVISPYVSLEVGFDAGADLSAQAFLSTTEERTYGARWNRSGWRTIKRTPRPRTSLSIQNITASLSAEPYLRTPFELRLYELLGPYLAFQPFGLFEVSSTVGQDPEWTVSAGVSGLVGVNTEPLSQIPRVDIKEDYFSEVAQVKWLVDRGTVDLGVPPELLEVPLNPSGEARDAAAALTWDAPDSDVHSGYAVFRSTRPFPANAPSLGVLASGGVQKVNDAPITAERFVDDGATNGTTYYYRIATTDGVGSFSEGSTLVEVTPLPNPPDRP